MLQLHQLLLAQQQQHQQQLLAQQQLMLLQQQQQGAAGVDLPGHLTGHNPAATASAALPSLANSSGNIMPLSNSSVFGMGAAAVSGGGINLPAAVSVPEASNAGVGGNNDVFAKLLAGVALGGQVPPSLPDKQVSEQQRSVDPISSLLEQLKVREMEDKKQMQLIEQQKQMHEQQLIEQQQQQKLLAEQKLQEQQQQQQRLREQQQQLQEQQRLREQQELQAVVDSIMKEEPEAAAAGPSSAGPANINHYPADNHVPEVISQSPLPSRQQQQRGSASPRKELTPAESSSGADAEARLEETISPEEVATFQVGRVSLTV